VIGKNFFNKIVIGQTISLSPCKNEKFVVFMISYDGGICCILAVSGKIFHWWKQLGGSK